MKDYIIHYMALYLALHNLLADLKERHHYLSDDEVNQLQKVMDNSGKDLSSLVETYL